jgi:pyruvate formate lyase activating enzyme
MEALLYEKLENGNVRCVLCSHRCMIKPGKSGICHVRENQGGTLRTKVYGRLIAQHVDPIEKKPLFHVHPGSRSYSIATVGCNFKCRFCQNADIAQMPAAHRGRVVGDKVQPQEVVRSALRQDCRTIAYTYTEPTIYYEYAYDTAKLARQAGLLNVFVSNGYMTAEALQMIAPVLDAANVDLKAFNDAFYRTYCGARLEHVKQTLLQMKSVGVYVEVTTLIIPGLNDDRAELRALATFLADSLGPATPWHISRFHPTYKLTDRPATPVDTLLKAREIGLQAGLRYVYTGNVPGEESESTFCHQCGKCLIERWGFSIRSYNVQEGRCPECGAEVAGIGM